MDITGFFKGEVFRPIVITLIPGLIAIAPWIMVLSENFDSLISYYKERDLLSSISILVLAIAAGFVVENLASRIEVAVWKLYCYLNDYAGECTDEWYRYLRLSYDKPPIAIGYINDVVLRMKFENSLTVALIFGALGLCKSTYWDLFGWPSILALLTLLVYLIFESYSSTKTLATVRRELLKASIILSVNSGHATTAVMSASPTSHKLK